MVNPPVEQVDVWIVGFDVPAATATSGIATVFGVDVERAAALVASVPRGVRRGIDRSAAADTVAALTSIGARVEVLPFGQKPVIVPPPPRPRVALKRAPANAAWLEDEPAYGVGSSAYVPFGSPHGSAVSAERDVEADLDAYATPAIAQAGADDLASAAEPWDADDDFFGDDLQLGSLIPAPAPEAVEELQLELARLPKVQPTRPNPRPLDQPIAPATAAAPAHGATRGHAAQAMMAGRPDPAAASAGGNRTLLAVAIGATLLCVALLIGRWVLGEDAAGEVAPSASGDAQAGPSDADLMAACAGHQLVDARTWLHLGELNRFGDLDPAATRALFARLTTSGAITASVGVESESSSRAAYLLLQHTPFHVDALLQAATSDASVSPACVQVSPRYMLLDFSACP